MRKYALSMPCTLIFWTIWAKMLMVEVMSNYVGIGYVKIINSTNVDNIFHNKPRLNGV